MYLVLKQKRLPSPDSFLKGRGKVTASFDSHQEAMRWGRIEVGNRRYSTNRYSVGSANYFVWTGIDGIKGLRGLEEDTFRQHPPINFLLPKAIKDHVL